MKNPVLPALLLLLIFVPVLAAQKWEFGGGAGMGIYTSQDVKGSAGTGSVTIKSGLAGSAWLDNNNNRRWGGELRYDYQMGDLQVSSQSVKGAFAAQTHGIHYDFLFHTAGRDAKIRPFVAFGGGVKVYQGTGTEVAVQPLNHLALLTKTSETTALASVGAGVKINYHRFGFRIEVHDFMTPTPKQVIVPAQYESIGGWLHDFVVDFGVSLLF